MKVVILGSGGHARVAADIALEMGHQVLGFLDDSPTGETVLGMPVLGPIRDWEAMRPDAVALGIGSNGVRRRLMERYPNAPWLTLIHPYSAVSRFAQIGAGSMIAFGACIGPGAKIGQGVIVNTKASVDHDCDVGDFVHIAVAATLAGTVQVGSEALIGAGAVVIQNLAVGSGSIVGAGAAVVRDVPAGVTVMGVPARIATHDERV